MSDFTDLPHVWYVIYVYIYIYVLQCCGAAVRRLYIYKHIYSRVFLLYIKKKKIGKTISAALRENDFLLSAALNPGVLRLRRLIT